MSGNSNIKNNGDVPLFSVVISTFNRASLLKRALVSVSAQTCTDFEVIVCDDGSNDNTFDVVEEFKSKFPLTYLYEENWGGAARPRNRGIQVARGAWICFLDSDDWWYPNKLEKVYQGTKHYDVIHHNCYVYTKHGRNLFNMRGRQLRDSVFVDLMTGWNGLHTSTVCVKRQLLLECEGFSEDRSLIAIEDFDLWLRLSTKTNCFLHIPQSLGAYWVAEGNISNFTDESITREQAIFKKYASLLPPVFVGYAEKMLAYRKGIILWHLGRFAESRQMFLKSLWPKKWRNRLLVPIWIAGTFLPIGHKHDKN